MKTLGILGGIGPESTIVYYRTILDLCKRQGLAAPRIIINSIDVTRLLQYVAASDLQGLISYLAPEIERLAQAGADIALMAANTPHLVFDQIEKASPIPLISIVDSACDAVTKLGFHRVGLFGTRFVMQSDLYHRVLSRQAISVVVPEAAEQTFIDDKYQNELLKNVFHTETRDALYRIIERMKRDCEIEALILGGTELPLLLRDPACAGIPLLDTSVIHAQAALAKMALAS
jgi:aspartate racemase